MTRPTENGQRELVTLNFATTVSELEETAARLLGYSFVTEHVCMDCGCRVGGKALVAHAKEHAGIPVPPKAKANGQQAGGS